MKVLITGYDGFIGKNLCAKLKEKNIQFIEFGKKDNFSKIEKKIGEISFIFHLAGSNRPKKEKEFTETNYKLTKKIINLLRKKQLKIPILFTSSIQAKLKNPYGISKKLAEQELIKYSKELETPLFIYRLPNIFGKWGKPYSNSVIATFCYQISREEKIKINNPVAKLFLSYIDDIVEEFFQKIGKKSEDKFYSPKKIYKISLNLIVKKIIEFEKSRKNFQIPKLNDEFTKKLYSTYLSYLDPKKLSSPLNEKKDKRGRFMEILKSKKFGQFSISYSKQKIRRGEHYHHTKVEKFIVIKGKAKIRFRDIFGKNIIEYEVSDKNLEIIDIPPGYIHSIENIGKSEMILLIWANEIFNPNKPDTYFMEVEK